MLRPNNRHPHIGHAIAGLAREGDLDDVEDLTWARVRLYFIFEQFFLYYQYSG